MSKRNPKTVFVSSTKYHGPNLRIEIVEGASGHGLAAAEYFVDDVKVHPETYERVLATMRLGVDPAQKK